MKNNQIKIKKSHLEKERMPQLKGTKVFFICIEKKVKGRFR